jgi:hypothetical protein
MPEDYVVPGPTAINWSEWVPAPSTWSGRQWSTGLDLPRDDVRYAGIWFAVLWSDKRHHEPKCYEMEDEA